MKILYVGHTYTVRANHAKIAALARLPGVEITLVTPQGWKGPLYDNPADSFESAPHVTHRIVKAYFIGKESGYFYGPSIFTLIARLKPDIVHVEQGAYAISYAEILFAVRLCSPRSRCLFFTWWNLPYTPHGVKRILERFNLANSSAAIAGNACARDILRDHGFDKPITVLPQLGVDLPSRSVGFEPAHAGTIPVARAFTIGYAGRITEEKGVLDLVEAVGSMTNRDNITLYFVGGGAALQEVRRRTAIRGIPFVHHDAVRNEDVPAHLSRMDVLVLPSRTTPHWVEQFGHILLEAMASGVPVIGSSSGEIPNVIGDAGLIFPEGDTLALADALDLLRADSALRMQFAQRGIARIKERFTTDIIAREQFSFYKAILAGKTAATHSTKEAVPVV